MVTLRAPMRGRFKKPTHAELAALRSAAGTPTHIVADKLAENTLREPYDLDLIAV